MGEYLSVADDKNVINFDSHLSIVYFISRGYKCITHKNLLDRFFCWWSFLILKKMQSTLWKYYFEKNLLK